MNRYAEMARTHTRRHRPEAMATIADPHTHFAELGEQIEAAVTERRDEILGPQRRGETIDEYRRRGYQALRMAEEIVLADLLPLPTEDDDESPETDPSLTGYYRHLDEIATLTEPTSDPR